MNRTGKAGIRSAERKLSRVAANVAAGIVGSALAVSSASAANLYFDGDGLGAQNGGTGIWNLTLNRWTTTPGGTSYTTFAPGETAVFNGVGGAVVVPANLSASMSVQSNGYIFTGDTATASAPITWGGLNQIDVGTGITTELRLAANGTSLNKTGAGTLIFDSSLLTNATTSALNITQGTIQYGRSNLVATVGTGSTTTTIATIAQVHMAPGSVLDLGKHWNEAIGSINNDLTGPGTGPATIVLGSRQHTWNLINSGPNYTYGSTLMINGGNTSGTGTASLFSTFSGNIVSDGLAPSYLPFSSGRIYIGTSTTLAAGAGLQADVTLSGNNTFGGITTVAPGATLHVSGGQALSDTAPLTMINSNISFPLFELLSDEAIGSLGASGNGSTGHFSTGRSEIALNGNKLTIGGDNLNNDFTTNIADANAITGTSSAIIEKIGTGTQILSPSQGSAGTGTNYAGKYVVKGGKLLFSRDNVTGTGSGPDYFTLDGGTIGFHTAGAAAFTTPASKGITVLAGGGGLYGEYGVNPSLQWTIASAITGTGPLTKYGTITVRLFGADNSTFTGDWNIKDGVLVTGNGFGSTIGLGSKVMGTGSVNISGSWLEFYTDPAVASTDNQTMSAATATGKKLTYGPGAALFLYRNAANSLTVNVGDAGAAPGSNSNFVRDNTTKGTMLIMANSGPALLGTGAPASESLIVNGGVATSSVNGGANTVVPTVLLSTNTSVTEGFFATYNAANGFQAATMSPKTSILTTDNTDLYAATSTNTNTLSGGPASVYGVKIGSGATPATLDLNGQTLNVGGASNADPGVVIVGNGSTIAATGGGTLAFGGHEGIIYTETGTGAVNGTITGSAGLHKMGFGTLTLGSGAVTSYTGTTRIEQGSISISNSSQLTGADIYFSGTSDGSGVSNVGLLLNGNTLSVNSINSGVQAQFNVNAGGPRIDLGANGVLRVTGSGTSNLDAFVLSSGSTARIENAGSGTLKLGRRDSTNNDRSGIMSYNQLWVSGGGIIEVPTTTDSGSILSNVFPKAATGSFTTADTYRLGDATTSGTMRYVGVMANFLGGQSGTNQEGNFPNTVTPMVNRMMTIGAGGGTIDIESAYETVFLNSANAVFAGSGTLTKTGPGVLVLGSKESVATQDHTAQNWKLVVSGGIVSFSSTTLNDDLGVVPGTLDPTNITLTGGGEIDTNVSATTLGATRGIFVTGAQGGVIGSKGAMTFNAPLSGTGPLTIAGDNPTNAITFNASADGSVAGSGTFSGTVTLARSGPIIVAAANALGTGTITNDPTFPVGFGTSSGTTAAPIQLGNNFTINAGSTFDFITTTASSDLQLNGVISGGGNIYKGTTTATALASVGTLELNNAGNNFTGTFTVMRGTLIPKVNGALGSNAAPLVINTAGTLGFKGNVNYTNVKPTFVSGTGGIQNISDDNTYAGTITLTGPTNVTATSGSINLTSGILGGSGSALTTTGGGTVITKNVRTDGLNVNAGLLRISEQPNPSNVSSFAGTSKVGALAIASGARIDLTNNKLITSTGVGTWNGTAYGGVTGLIASGYSVNQDFSGTTGIVTTETAATGGNTLTNIGVASNADLGLTTFGGQSVGPSDTLVMYTYGGDANLDGAITGDDYFQIDSGFPAGASGWFNGDFNYDGSITGDDYFVIDSNFSAQGSSFAVSGGLPAGVQAVPEPASVALLSLGATAALSRRRRRRRHCDGRETI